jgi:hypothetical protein
MHVSASPLQDLLDAGTARQLVRSAAGAWVRHGHVPYIPAAARARAIHTYTHTHTHAQARGRASERSKRMCVARASVRAGVRATAPAAADGGFARDPGSGKLLIREEEEMDVITGRGGACMFMCMCAC